MSDAWTPRNQAEFYEFRLLGKYGGTVAAAAPVPTPAASGDINVLAASNGGQLLVAPNDTWARLIDGKEDEVYWFNLGVEAVFGFNDDKPATFSMFSTLIPGTGDNAKEIELLYGNDSPTGTFTWH